MSGSRISQRSVMSSAQTAGLHNAQQKPFALNKLSEAKANQPKKTTKIVVSDSKPNKY